MCQIHDFLSGLDPQAAARAIPSPPTRGNVFITGEKPTESVRSRKASNPALPQVSPNMLKPVVKIVGFKPGVIHSYCVMRKDQSEPEWIMLQEVELYPDVLAEYISDSRHLRAIRRESV